MAEAASGSVARGRRRAMRYGRIVVKAGTQVLTAGTGSLDMEAMSSLVGQISWLRSQGVPTVLVSSGAIAAGRHVLGLAYERSDVPFRQVLAAVGQSQLMYTYERLFSGHDIRVAQALLTRGDLTDRQGYLNIRNTLLALLELEVVPIINENDVVAAEEIGEEVFGDNDTLSALVANLVDADLLVMLGNIAGLYSADPQLDPQARLIPRVERVDASVEALAWGYHSPWSRGGMSTKLEATRLANASGVAVVIAHGREPDVVVRLASGEEVGTFFAPTSSHLESRKRWMLSGLSSRGEVQVDVGAAMALRSQNGSLLPAGVREVRGDFRRGDIVYIVDGNGERLACGIANYEAADVEAIKGARSDRIEAALGYQYGAEVVHRNNMVLL